jgi:lipopolysaccharide biosynthesis glycosyltransferase|tara:strand:+ start:1787 stop:2467 length:681 start_codon:yes stop_codon:yes gene_type:complete
MKSKLINIFVGFDQKESIAYHAFVQSLIDSSSIPLSITPLAENNLNIYNEKHLDGTNKFTYSRFLVPYLMNFKGWAIYFDGDMVCLSDVKDLIRNFDTNKAVSVIKHDYKTKNSVKYFGQKNEDYPRKNWSSVIIWNCEHPKNKILTPDFIESMNGAFLHRFKWLDNVEIGELDKKWNWLAVEYPEIKDANLIHYTLGTPCFEEYKNTSMANYWKKAFNRLMEGFK